MVAGGRDLEGQHAEGRGGEGGEREHGRNKFSACRDRGTFAGLKYGTDVVSSPDPPRIMIFGFRRTYPTHELRL